ncbi:MAG TPA: cupin domain-containing protein [Solirubrobacter sp.]|nr:cupin domain-containing protein [Solirubrobacter sp.]
MPVIAHTDAPTFELEGVRFTGLAAPSRGARENCVWTIAIEPGAPGVPHAVTREEVFVALEGRAELKLDGVTQTLAPGDAAVVAAETQFSLANPYDEPFRAVVVLPVGGQAVTADGAFTPPWAA